MIDSEVGRLRRLRNSALKARAIATALDSTAQRRDSVFSRGAVSCWQIARVITGKLRAHPYLSYQRGPSEVRGVYHRIVAGVLRHIARGRSLQIIAGELQRLAHELEDARALSWSADFGDAMGRSHLQIRRLIKELGAGENEAELGRTDPWLESRAGAAQNGADHAAAHWPYLAF